MRARLPKKASLPASWSAISLVRNRRRNSLPSTRTGTRALLAVPPVVEPAETVEPTEPRPPLSVLRRTHDHHRDFPTRDAATRAAGSSRTNRDGDAVTRHGSRPSDVVVMSLRPATLRAPSDSPASLSTLIQHAISGFAHPWPRISAPIARQNFQNGDREQPGGTPHPSPTTQPSPQIPISRAPHTAGSFLGDFRTPRGARNSSRKSERPLWSAQRNKQTFVRGIANGCRGVRMVGKEREETILA